MEVMLLVEVTSIKGSFSEDDIAHKFGFPFAAGNSER